MPPRLDQALLDRLVAVAVAERDLVLADDGAEDRAVRAGGADEDVVAAVRSEDARRVLLRFLDRARVVEQRSERTALDAGIGAEQVLAVEVEEQPADRRLGEGDAALMSGRGPRVLAHLVVADQRLREGRHEVLEVAADRGHRAARDQRRRVLEHPDALVGELHHLDGDRVRGSPGRPAGRPGSSRCGCGSCAAVRRACACDFLSFPPRFQRRRCSRSSRPRRRRLRRRRRSPLRPPRCRAGRAPPPARAPPGLPQCRDARACRRRSGDGAS